MTDYVSLGDFLKAFRAGFRIERVCEVADGRVWVLRLPRTRLRRTARIPDEWAVSLLEL